MAEYVDITLEQMDDFLVDAQHFRRIVPEAVGHPCHEAVYERHYDDSGCRIRIYSSVDMRDEGSRGVGNDAIRVVIVDPEGYAWNKSFKRVHRVKGWRLNLMKRYEPILDFSWNYAWAAPYPCPSCNGGILRTRWGKKGPFMGCSGYNPKDPMSCRNTEPVRTNELKQGDE